MVKICVHGDLRVSTFVYDKSFYIMPKVLSNSTCALRRVIREKMTCWYSILIANRLLYMIFFFAISFGLVRMLFFQSIMQSNGGVSRFLNTFLFIFLG